MKRSRSVAKGLSFRAYAIALTLSRILIVGWAVPSHPMASLVNLPDLLPTLHQAQYKYRVV
ncbi:hypothetical protein [Moorena sp. SIO4G3]|uniref:hypothetical protein n=1 Tax=Moorena sp. SIO4G3 TaxID=2607821 RepID=UPI00142BC0ED|nr:hypothetical protein [Moorena sp. SIO4G3]NEO80858.1 hypothetical protein [Moorena sp. SIO4G3]